MTPERWLWWVILAWCFWRAWTANQKAEVAAKADTSGTSLIKRGAAAIEGKLAFVGQHDLLGAGGLRIEHITTVAIGANRYRITMEKIDG